MEKIVSARWSRNELVSKIYISIILGVFPLIYHDYYFDIMVFKYQFYYITTLIYISIILFNNVFFMIMDKETKLDFKKWYNKISMPELSIFFFMLISIISTLQSDFVYESFWGNEGRYTGCFTLILYCFSILLIIKYFKLKRWLLDLFLITGVIVCCFGITHYFKLDILGFKANIAPTQYNMFVSTIGNVNTYTSYVALIMAVSTLMYLTEKVCWKICFYYFCMVCSFFSIIMGLSDNSYLSIIALFGFLPLYAFKSKSGFRRYLFIVTTFLGIAISIVHINKTIPEKVLEMQGIIQHLPINIMKYFFVFMLCFTLFLYLEKYLWKDRVEYVARLWRSIWLVILLIIFGMLLFSLYDVNVALNSKRYGVLSQYLLFNDNWGTHRGFNWRIGMENYLNFPLTHKVFGYGPDTYGILTHINNYKEMTETYNELYDSAHNEYLQYFITMGPLSLISYMIFLGSSILGMVKKSEENRYVIPIIFAVLCYSIQAAVNISVPIVSPIMFVLLASGIAAYRNDFT